MSTRFPSRIGARTSQEIDFSINRKHLAIGLADMLFVSTALISVGGLIYALLLP